jgi:hypothetical protein
MTSPLTGPDLLDYVEGLAPDVSVSEAAHRAGHFYTTKSGQVRVKLSSYYRALAEAKGVEFKDSKTTAPGRPLAYSGKIGTKGAAIIGPAYLSQLGLKPGDRFSIAVFPADGCDLPQVVIEPMGDEA